MWTRPVFVFIKLWLLIDSWDQLGQQWIKEIRNAVMADLVVLLSYHSINKRRCFLHKVRVIKREHQLLSYDLSLDFRGWVLIFPIFHLLSALNYSESSFFSSESPERSDEDQKDPCCRRADVWLLCWQESFCSSSIFREALSWKEQILVSEMNVMNAAKHVTAMGRFVMKLFKLRFVLQSNQK